MIISKCSQHNRKELEQQVMKMISGENVQDQASMMAAKILDSNDVFAYMLKNNNQAVGFYVLKFEPYDGGNGLGEITFLQVDQKNRGKGLGTKLVNHAIETARDSYIRKIYVLTSPQNVNATCFWLRNRFEFEVRMKDFCSAGHDDYYLSRTLF